MNAGQKRARQLAARASLGSFDDICASCLRRLTQRPRRYATAAVAEASNQERSPPDAMPIPHAGPQKAYRLLISPVISRSPILTRALTPFEKSFYLYQKRLNERLAMPWNRYFYHSEKSPAGELWTRQLAARKTHARDIGVYDATGKEAWNDEVLIGDDNAEIETVMEKLVLDAEGRTITSGELVQDQLSKEDDSTPPSISGDPASGEGTAKELESRIERPMPRVSEADQSNDRKSLSRKMDRALYLLVKNADGRWRFPEARMVERESLHQAAERIIVQSAGLDMNTWVVGNHPVGHFEAQYREPQNVELQRVDKHTGEETKVSREELGEKVFFMKARIMAGQANVTDSIHGATDFEWLVKEEVQQRVGPQYWSYVRNMLTER